MSASKKSGCSWEDAFLRDGRLGRVAAAGVLVQHSWTSIGGTAPRAKPLDQRPTAVASKRLSTHTHSTCTGMSAIPGCGFPAAGMAGFYLKPVASAVSSRIHSSISYFEEGSRKIPARK